jgi:hypothetical protein
MQRIAFGAAFAAAICLGLLGISKPASATPIGPGNNFNIFYSVPDGTYNHASWELNFNDGGLFQPGQSIQIDVYDFTDTVIIGSQTFAQPFPDPVGNISSGFFLTAPYTPPPGFASGYFHFTSIDATFDVNLATSSVTLDNELVAPVPVPAALPLFVSGLGALGLLARRRRKQSAA